VTGRRISTILDFVQLQGLHYAGSHGFEIRLPGTSVCPALLCITLHMGCGYVILMYCASFVLRASDGTMGKQVAGRFLPALQWVYEQLSAEVQPSPFGLCVWLLCYVMCVQLSFSKQLKTHAHVCCVWFCCGLR
jgi:hypothetical protein